MKKLRSESFTPMSIVGQQWNRIQIPLQSKKLLVKKNYSYFTNLTFLDSSQVQFILSPTLERVLFPILQVRN